MNKTEVRRLIENLAKRRPMFDDEKDFQYSLAHEIVQANPNCSLCLEGRPLRIESDLNYDICIFHEDSEVFFELKFKPTRLTATINSRRYKLKHHSAQDLYSYDYLYDVWKLEQAVALGTVTGFAIFLTNDSLYWRGARRSSDYYPFRLQDQRVIESQKTLSWSNNREKKGKMRQLDIILNQDYTLNWQDYATIEKGAPLGNSQFKFLLLEIKKS